MKMSEGNKALMRQIYDVINTGDVDRADELLAEDMVEHEEFPGLDPGREGFKQFVRTFRSAFPDLRFEIEDMIAEGDRVAARVTMTGTHEGEFMGMPATGKQIRVSSIDIGRFENGKGVEHWGATDTMAMMQQLGALPEMAQG